MLRIEFQEKTDETTIRMAGRLVGSYATNLRQLVANRMLPLHVVADLSELTFVDEAGEEFLLWLDRIGVQFAAESSYSLDLCERLRLQTCGNPTIDSRGLRKRARRTPGKVNSS